MGVDNVLSAIQSNISKINTSATATVLPCVVVKVYKENMTADVYLKGNSAIKYNVPLCFPSKGRGYGAYFIPKEGATYLLLYSSLGRPYLLTYAPVTVSSDEGGVATNEKAMPGENLIQSCGDANLKQDLVGNNMGFSGLANSMIQDSQGANRSYALGSQELTVALKHISGFSLNPNASTTETMLTSTEQKVSDYSEFYSALNSPKIYKTSEIFIAGEIVESVKSIVINSAKNTIDKIAEFKTAFISIKSQMQDMTSSDSALEALTEQLYDQMKNFNIEKKGVKIVIEKGNAINKTKRPRDISDIRGLQSSDYDTLDGVEICYRMLIEDDSSNTLVKVEIDKQGNCNAIFNKLTVSGELSFIDATPGELIDGGSWD